jgi:hypothetical protein
VRSVLLTAVVYWYADAGPSCQVRIAPVPRQVWPSSTTTASAVNSATMASMSCRLSASK